MKKKDFLKKLWIRSPLSWAIIRASECELLSQATFKPPILEIGCGDGLVTSIICNHKHNAIDVGIDLDRGELRRAKKTGVYKKLLHADITANTFNNGSFNTVFANGVLEHIPDLEKAMKEIARILKPGGVLLTTSPTDNYTHLLFYYRLFNKLHLYPLAKYYDKKINGVFVHRHLLSQKQWTVLCHKNDMQIKKLVNYNNGTLIALHDLCLPFAIMTKFLKEKTDSMVLFPKLRQRVMPFLVDFINPLLTSPKFYNDAGSIFIEAIKRKS